MAFVRVRVLHGLVVAAALAVGLDARFPTFVEGRTTVSARLPATAERAIAALSVDELRSHVETLASDEFAGRGINQPGNRRAETYVAESMRRSGAVPAVEGRYLQPVAIFQPALRSDSVSTLKIVRRGAVLLEARVGEHFYPLPESGAGTATGRLVFAGHGISAAREGHDDFAQRDVRGAIVLVLDGAPPRLRDAAPDLYSVARKARNAAEHGAAGLVVVTPQLTHPRAVWPDEISSTSAPYRLFSDTQKAGLPVGTVSEAAAAAVRRALDSGAELTATLTSDVTANPVTINNVLALVEGAQSSRGEMVVVGAHLDHDGVDTDGRIFNGADDNASGTAAVLAMAGAFARAAADGERPARAVLFALWNGEEKGSLGAEAYAEAPVPSRRVVASINLDMIGRAEHVPDPDDTRFRGFAKTAPGSTANVLHLLGYSYSADLAHVFTVANEDIGLQIQQQYDVGAQDLLRRSDHWPFLRRGIPAVFLTTGLHPDYHTPDDDVERIDFGKLHRIARLAARAAWLVADGPAPQMRK
jgi:Peptidase family M28/PA domain